MHVSDEAAMAAVVERVMRSAALRALVEAIVTAVASGAAEGAGHCRKCGDDFREGEGEHNYKRSSEDPSRCNFCVTEGK